MSFSNGQVSVDRNFVRVGSKSYAVDKIGSIDIRTRHVPPNRKYLLLWIGAVFAFLAGINPLRWDLMALAAFLFGAGYVVHREAKSKHFHSIVLLTTAGEAVAFESSDIEEIADIRDAIEAAMVAR